MPLHLQINPVLWNLSTGLLFITAPSATANITTRLLLHLHDWEHGSGDRFHLVTSRMPGSLHAHFGPRDKEGTYHDVMATSAPCPDDFPQRNEWTGASLFEVEEFMVQLYEEQERAQRSNGHYDDEQPNRKVNTHAFVVLDEQGLHSVAEAGEDEDAWRTCILGERVEEWNAIPQLTEYPEEFKKARVPWYQTQASWLQCWRGTWRGWERMMEGRMDEEDDKGDGEGGWWEYNTRDAGQYISEEKKKARDREMERLVEKGAP